MSLILLLLYATIQRVTAYKDHPYDCEGVEMVPRTQWGARPSSREWVMALPVNIVIIEHTGVSWDVCSRLFECSRVVRSTQDYHLDDRGWADIGYNFMVGGDGRVYEGLGWNKTGAHSINFNTKSVAVTFMGNFNVDEPTEQMLTAARRLIDCGVQKGFLAPTKVVHGHRDVACTESPGNKLYAKIQEWGDYVGGRIKDWDCS